MKCELCGTDVKVVGNTTKHYEPVNDLAKQAGVIDELAKLYKIKKDNIVLIEELEEAEKEISELKRLFKFRCECDIISESSHKCSACYTMELHEAKYKGKE